MEPRQVKSAADALKIVKQGGLSHVKVGVHEKEVSLKQAQQQITKHEKQLNEATSKKEYDALKVEIAAEKQRCQQLEDEILNGMMEMEERTAQLPEIEKAVTQARWSHQFKVKVESEGPPRRAGR